MYTETPQYLHPHPTNTQTTTRASVLCVRRVVLSYRGPLLSCLPGGRGEGHDGETEVTGGQTDRQTDVGKQIKGDG
ncbi:hypothetical protein E2C01_077448 [Portunus trituberculatus]|uniref:Uncharacterized protein n=1 Tax=Portunus trituberculatus TaxID=210409 RepID=A0A5B7IMB3_PORTR|nr:hypothetical protein [Portunus trituberculatus]